MKKVRIFAAAALTLSQLSGVTSPQLANAQTVVDGYRLGPDDQIEVTIYGQSEQSIRTRIKSNGTITLPLVGSIVAAGETVQSLSTAIERKLKAGGFLNNPIVNIEIGTYASQTVTLLGEIGSPGIQPLDHPQTLGEMLARAGGLKPDASDFVSIRHANTDQTERYSLNAIARSAQRDVRLRPGDVIYVGEAEHYFIYGQIGNAGVYAVLPNMTVRQALARAGGPTQAGSEKKVTLYRGGKELDADLAGLVQPDDVLFVRERVF